MTRESHLQDVEMSSVPKIDLEEVARKRNPGFYNRYPNTVRRFLIRLFARLMHVEKINAFMEAHRQKRDMEFVDVILEQLDFSYAVSRRDRQRIPASGPLVCVCNHPLGALDGLSVLRAVGEVRRDVFIVVERELFHIDNLRNTFVHWDDADDEKPHTISSALANEAAVICFPAAEVSRLSSKGVRDRAWVRDVLNHCRKYKAPVLPVYVDGRNSLLFYFMCKIRNHWGTLLLPREAFRQHGGTLEIRIGDPIPVQAFFGVQPRVVMKLLRKHVLALGKKKRKEIFRTETTIIHPVERQALKRELLDNQRLETTADRFELFLVHAQRGGQVLREIARLREMTFRKVGEGTGKKLDTDRHDGNYQHLILWDDDELEIVGSYRLGLGSKLCVDEKQDDFYSASLFAFKPRIVDLLPQTLELGRSFIQQAYWNTRALDHLWYGIGAFLKIHTHVRYLLGPVSISRLYPDEVKDFLVYFYTKWFTPDELGAIPRKPYDLNPQVRARMARLFDETDYRKDYRILKNQVRSFGFSVPTLFHQYTSLCDREGITIHGFNIDPDFSDCVDGLILLDLNFLKPEKRKRYLE